MSPYTTPRAPTVAVTGSTCERGGAATGVAVTGSRSQGCRVQGCRVPPVRSRGRDARSPVCDDSPQIATGLADWLVGPGRERTALWRAVRGYQTGLADHALGPGGAEAGSFEIGPCLLRAIPADRANVQPVTLGKGVRHAGFHLRS